MFKKLGIFCQFKKTKEDNCVTLFGETVVSLGEHKPGKFSVIRKIPSDENEKR